MTPRSAARKRREMARDLGLDRLTLIQRSLVKDLLAYRLKIDDPRSTDHEREQARTRYGRTVDRLTSRAVRRGGYRGRRRSR